MFGQCYAHVRLKCLAEFMLPPGQTFSCGILSNVPSTSVPMAISASSCTPPTTPVPTLSIWSRASMIGLAICNASWGFTFLRTLCWRKVGKWVRHLWGDCFVFKKNPLLRDWNTANLVLTFESVDEILKCNQANESYWAVLSCVAVYYAVQGSSIFWVQRWNPKV